jgi:succinyl-CoA synthetase beta subunit
MNIHEYQAKEILQKNGVQIQRGVLIDKTDESLELAKALNKETGTEWFVAKAQIHAGGRGKGVIRETGSNGVVLAKSIDAVPDVINNIINGTLVTKQTGEEGKKVHKVLLCEDVYYPGESKPEEFYVSVLLDRHKECNVIMASREGGVDIEEVAEKQPEKIIKEWIDPASGLQNFQARKVAFALGLEGKAFKEMVKFIMTLYKAYEHSDASLVEINPALKTSDSRILAVDAKFNIDDNALFRHSDIAEMRDKSEESELEVEANEAGLNYIKLDGNVGCMVNGAGLAMATMDIIKLSGGEPANFLDVGGGANAKTVESGFRIILKDTSVKAILINIFGGIVRCDRVANGVVEAYKALGSIDVPVIVRLQGTNAEQGKDIIDSSGLKVHSAISLREAADLVKKMV